MSTFVMHSASGLYYERVGEFTHTETGERLTAYHALYEPTDPTVDGFWARPAAMWDELVEVNGQMVPRFVNVEDGDPAHHVHLTTYEASCPDCGEHIPVGVYSQKKNLINSLYVNAAHCGVCNFNLRDASLTHDDLISEKSRDVFKPYYPSWQARINDLPALTR